MREGKESQKASCMIRMYNVSEYYKILEKVGRGTYGTVYKARGLKDNKFYAIKKLENNDVKLQQQGFPITALREITLLKQIDHPNIIKLKEIILSRPNKRNLFRGSTFLVFEYMDHDFAGLFKMRRRFEVPEMKCIFKQLIEGVAYLHRNKILHRDIKSANILLNDDGEVKLADFGLGRKVRLESIFTYKVVTLWYRAPELLLGHKHYSNKIDVWSIGCVVAEFLTGEVLFKKESQHAQMERIYEICGDFQANDFHISEEASKAYQYFADMKPKKSYKKSIASYFRNLCPQITDITIQFLEGLLSLDPNKRLSCQEALRHPYFNEKPLACTNREIQKQEYECHEMFKDRSIKIERPNKKDYPDNSKNAKAAKQEKNYKDYHKRQKSMTPQSKRREFSSSSSRSSHTDSASKGRNKSKSRSRSRERQHRRRSRSREDNGKRHSYNDKRHRDRSESPRKDRYRRDVRDDRKDRREDYKTEKDRRVQERQDKYYREKPEKRYKDDRRKDDRYDRYDQRRDKDDRREMKQDRRQPKQDRRQPKDDRRDLKEDRRDAKDDRRQRDKDDRRERRPQYRRDSKQKKYDKYQKGRYESRYQPKSSKYRNDQQKDYKRRQQRKEKDHQSKYQASKQKYSDYRSQKKSDKFVFVRQKGHRKKQVSSSSSSSSYSSHHYKKQKQHRSKYSYDRKAYYKKQHSSSGSRGYH